MTNERYREIKNLYNRIEELEYLWETLQAGLDVKISPRKFFGEFNETLDENLSEDDKKAIVYHENSIKDIIVNCIKNKLIQLKYDFGKL